MIVSELRRRLKRIPGVPEVYRRVRLRFYEARRRWERLARGGPARGPEILFFPHTPSLKSVAFKVCQRLGCRIARRRGGDVALAVRFEYATFKKAECRAGRVSGGIRTINSDVHDISKTHVDAVMKETFGYGVGVDPCQYYGRMVRKSNLNARHDGQVVNGPLLPAEVVDGCVYQRVVDNRDGPDLVVDIRVLILEGLLPFVYLKYRPVDTRFNNRNLRVEKASIEGVLTPSERERIRRFAQRMGLEFGELDVLRDAEDGRIFVVDVNDTPNGPPNQIPEEAGREAIAHIASRFERQFLQSAAARDCQWSGVCPRSRQS